MSLSFGMVILTFVNTVIKAGWHYLYRIKIKKQTWLKMNFVCYKNIEHQGKTIKN